QKFISLNISCLSFLQKKSGQKFMEFVGLLRLSIASRQSKWDPEDWPIANSYHFLKRCTRFGWRSCVKYGVRRGGRFWAGL
ncbi:MAG: hypothetical protein AAGD05_05895, partial [Bacteroidota bacterium]